MHKTSKIKIPLCSPGLTLENPAPITVIKVFTETRNNYQRHPRTPLNFDLTFSPWPPISNWKLIILGVNMEQSNSNSNIKSFMIASSIDKDIYDLAVKKLMEKNLVPQNPSKYSVVQAIFRDFVGAPRKQIPGKYAVTKYKYVPEEAINDFLSYMKTPRSFGYSFKNGEVIETFFSFSYESSGQISRFDLAKFFFEWLPLFEKKYGDIYPKKIIFSDFFKGIKKVVGGYYSNVSGFDRKEVIKNNVPQQNTPVKEPNQWPETSVTKWVD